MSEQPCGFLARGTCDGGFGLMLLRTLSDRWGIATDDGTCVSFELGVGA